MKSVLLNTVIAVKRRRIAKAKAALLAEIQADAEKIRKLLSPSQAARLLKPRFTLRLKAFSRSNS